MTTPATPLPTRCELGSTPWRPANHSSFNGDSNAYQEGSPARNSPLAQAER